MASTDCTLTLLQESYIETVKNGRVRDINAP